MQLRPHLVSRSTLYLLALSFLYSFTKKPVEACSSTHFRSQTFLPHSFGSVCAIMLFVVTTCINRRIQVS
ncbi:hypothetical protein BT69DRAFT_1280460 [Atractiella rhizophila]|nr:hypothetical protein BT69DRAFT_1280460 [Atractiella rhizophila]